MPEPTLDLESTYLHLDGAGSAVAFPGGAAFWAALASGAPPAPGLARVAAGGWLVARYRFESDWTSWEMHPRGEEVLVLLSGEVEFALDGPGGQGSARLRAGETLLVPRGTWHKARVLRAAEVLGITAGEGTQHRPG